MYAQQLTLVYLMVVTFFGSSVMARKLGSTFGANRKICFLSASQTFLKPAGPPKTKANPNFRDRKFEKIQKIFTTIKF